MLYNKKSKIKPKFSNGSWFYVCFGARIMLSFLTLFGVLLLKIFSLHSKKLFKKAPCLFPSTFFCKGSHYLTMDLLRTVVALSLFICFSSKEHKTMQFFSYCRSCQHCNHDLKDRMRFMICCESKHKIRASFHSY